MTASSKIFRATIFLGFSATLVIFLLEANRRHDLYWYDVRQDYQYSFKQENLEKIPVRITTSGVNIPELEGSPDTVLLPINIEATLTGGWFEPTITVQSPYGSWVHTYERGAKGKRYLVLDPDTVQSGTMLRFSASHVRWKDQASELLLFSNSGVREGNLLVIATHPDDAEIAAFGLYSGRRSFVATVSAGNYVDGLYSHLSPDPDEQKRLRGLARAWDSLVVPTWGGVPPQQTVNLGYWNGSLQQLHQRRDQRSASEGVLAQDPNLYRSGAIAELVDNRRAEATWRSLVSDLAAIVVAVTPAVIVAPHPALDAAKDHQYTTLALLEALDAVGDDSTVLLLYTNHHVQSEYFPFGPIGSVVDLPPWFDPSGQYFRIYAHWLTKDDQIKKLFALEAMHDLRAPPKLVTGGPTGRFLGRINAGLDELIRNPLDTYSYIRRAVRANEIFFVVGPGDRSSIEESFAFP